MSVVENAMATPAAGVTSINVEAADGPISEPFTLTAAFDLPQAVSAATWQVSMAVGQPQHLRRPMCMAHELLQNLMRCTLDCPALSLLSEEVCGCSGGVRGGHGGSEAHCAARRDSATGPAARTQNPQLCGDAHLLPVVLAVCCACMRSDPSACLSEQY